MKKYLHFIKIVVTISIIATLTVNTYATDLTGTYTTPQTLTVGNSPYNVVANTIFDNDLTIEAGVEIRFDDNYTFTINGLLTANGTSSDNITFKSDTSINVGSIVLNVSDPIQSEASYWKLEHLSTGIDLNNQFEISNMIAQDCNTGFDIGGGGTLSDFEATSCSYGLKCSSSGTISDGVITACSEIGIQFTGGPNYTLNQVEIKQCAKHGIDMPTTGNGTININDCNIHHNGLSGTFNGINACLSGFGAGNYVEVRNLTLNLNNTTVKENVNIGILLEGYYSSTCGTRISYLHCFIVGGLIENNGSDGIHVSSYVPDFTVHGCNLFDNGGKTVKVDVTNNYDITDNWWGTTDGTVIHNMISAVNVDYVPFLDGSNGNSTYGNCLQGNSMGDQHLQSGNTYIVLGNTTFNVAEHLEIDPGVIIKYIGNYAITVDGLLTANGTSSEYITFKSGTSINVGSIVLNVSDPIQSEASYWKLEHLSTGIDLNNYIEISNMIAEVCNTGFDIGGGGTLSNFEATSCSYGLKCSTSGTISDGVITGCSEAGIQFTGGPNYTLNQVEIKQNAKHGIDIPTTGNGTINMNDCNIHNNGISGTFNGINAILSNPGNNTTRNLYLNLNNTTVKENTNTGIQLQGYFSSYYGRYNYIHCSIVGGMIENNVATGINTENYAYLDIDNSTVKENGGYGIVYRGTDNIELYGLVISENGNYGVQINQTGSNLKFLNCVFHNNTTYDLYNNTGSIIDAKSNYWYALDSTEIAQRIYDFYDNSSKGEVKFVPFLLQPPQYLYLPADFNFSGRVDGFDLAILAVAFGSEPGDPNWNVLCDLNGSLQIDGFDLAIFATYFGQQTYKNSNSLFAVSDELFERLSMNPAKIELIQVNEDCINPGDEFSVFAKVSNFEQALGLAFNLNYDKELLELIEVNELKLFSNNLETAFLKYIDNSKGKAIIGNTLLELNENGMTGSGSLFEFKFKAKNKKGIAKLDFTNLGLLGLDGKTHLPVNYKGTTIQIGDNGLNNLVFELFQNQPNPFNFHTKIKYTVPENTSAMTELEIFDIQGQKIKTLVKEIQKPGIYSIQFDRTNDNRILISPGIYFCQLRIGTEVAIIKMMVK